ncbi:PQQ-dependent sugar dehydrogenase [Streptomyces sp. A3M-1-3]|uniref:PQQ-dependent sugar dehydrogenase n=1 Tax=Streptomyces sp. A3M-1-3 TaxID=2962044 RepID=UPI0020B74A91|nr:PQQ-dependent sugar dehydrogenase [Streptomyces sp. A3M-1-3]MCP3821711.1 PQQ-dependent sugar dehydrogenase [Streptomyces sp. A3M-1-3]
MPWGISFLPDGKSAVVTDRNTFVVWRIQLDGSKKQIGTVPYTVRDAEKEEKGGLLGAAVSPGWNGTTDKAVFFMQTTAMDNRVVKMSFDGTSFSGYTPVLTGIQRDAQHNGGKIAFGPDGFLHVATGDPSQGKLAQNKSSLNGKILRVTKTGAAAPGNPFGTHVYSYGHRNPQGLAWDRNGRLRSAEIGHTTADELNLIKPGANYGWPTCEGVCSVAGMTNPKKSWTPQEGVPSQIAIERNVIYVSTLRSQRLWRVPIDGNSERVGTATAYYTKAYGRLRAIAKVPGTDQLWLGTSDPGRDKDQILKVTIK